MKEYERWLTRAVGEPSLIAELQSMTPAARADAFYRNLSFGTGGLRGLLGAGTNRMNVYTVAKATQGLANYVIAKYPPAQRSIAVSYDSRMNSRLFSQVVSGVFAANNIHVFLYPQLMPVPCLSFAVRELGCAAGVMITASHNPARYNGYKVYRADGCQITTEAADEILKEIEKLDIFDDVQRVDFTQGLSTGQISYIPDEVYTAFIEAVKGESVLFGETVDKNVSIVYTPLNGTGLKPVLRTLRESGFAKVTVVKEQELPDGNFPTCPDPNPEIKEAMALGIVYAQTNHADLLLATDPDCDRIGIAVRNHENQFQLLSGNETGMLLLDYICFQRKKHGKLPPDAIMIKTIVTSDMAERIAASYGVETINVLTGFKFIGEQIGRMEEMGQINRYLFGFEESFGYLSGCYVRDKDAVNAALLICEMFAHYKTYGIGLLNKLEELYQAYGYCLDTLHSYTFEGQEGFVRIRDIMTELRTSLPHIGGQKIIERIDYAQGLEGLPKADVLKFIFDCGSIVVRPSGTEPKLKLYFSVTANGRQAAEERTETLRAALTQRIFPESIGKQA